MQPDSLRILVVDDEVVARTVLEEHLRAAGHQVIVVADAAAAMRVLERDPVQVVISDWVMPNMTGLDLCRNVHDRFPASPPHFVMLTVHAEKDRLIEAFDAGVDDFLTKPVHEGELLARLRAWSRVLKMRDELGERHRQAMSANEALASANKKLELLATLDELTGLLNRREAMRRLGEQWSVAVRYDHPLACAVIDVDHFKSLNDQSGHAYGDEVLKHIAMLLQSSLRATDGAFRVGGDEFLVLLPYQTADTAARWAERFLFTLATRRLAPEREAVTVSIGIAERTPSLSSCSELLAVADGHLYSVKRAGRAGVRASA